MSVKSCFTTSAFRILVSMSAIGSVIIALPARLLHTGDVAQQRPLTEANPAQGEPADEGPRPPAEPATVAQPARKLRLFVKRLLIQRFSCHYIIPAWRTAHPSAPAAACPLRRS